MQWAQERQIDVSWIILTGRGTFEDARRAVQLGAYDFVTKPLDSTDAMLVTVRNAIRQRRLESDRRRLVADVEQRNDQLNQQVVQLREACRLLKDQAQTISDDLRRAELIQRALLPRTPPETGEFVVNALYRPSQKVGGDIYDVLNIDGRYVIGYVADAAGHGVSAAMLAVLFKHRLHMMEEDQREPTSPAAVLELVNRCLIGECKAPALFVTAAYFVIDREQRRLSIASAGHPPILLRRATGEVERIYHTGPALGLTATASFAQQDMPLGPEDELLIYTDGLLDGRRGSQLHADEVASRLADGPEGQQMLRDLLDRCLEASGPSQSDDITLVLIGGRGSSSQLDNGTPTAVQTQRRVSQAPRASLLIGRSDERTTVSLQGNLNWQFSAAFHEHCLSELKRGRPIRLDMSLCFYLDSTFLGTVQEIAEFADHAGVRLEIQGLLPEVRSLFEELGMDRPMAHVSPDMTPLPVDMESLAEGSGDGQSDELRVLQAHEALASLNDSNRQQFGKLIDQLRQEACSGK
jgi:serine phosphatase RsbU (regulator of sigma subunit)/anti-anti-sigma regulatory factor